MFIYVLCLLVYAISHMTRSIKAYRKKNTRLLFSKVPVPQYLSNWQDALNLGLTIVLALMAILEPLFDCLMSPDDPVKDDRDSIFIVTCAAATASRKTTYGFF